MCIFILNQWFLQLSRSTRPPQKSEAGLTFVPHRLNPPPPLNLSLSLQTHRVFVHVAPNSSSNFTGEQDDEAGEELQEGPETQEVSARALSPATGAHLPEPTYLSPATGALP